MQTNEQHQARDLISIFNDTFSQSYKTQLVSGSEEPLYLPASNRRDYHQVIFAHGFFRSALHEIAHWCIAGRVRRQLLDYGYWYKPDGRSVDEQRQFENVECKPQALEWIFCLCTGHSFEVSCDNLASTGTEALRVKAFTEKVKAQRDHYLLSGMPERALLFAQALCNYYQQSFPCITEVA